MKFPKDPLFRLLLINGCAGVVIAILLLAGIFLANIGNLRILVLTAEDPVLPVLMLGFGLVITLGSVVMGSAIMLLGDGSRGGGTPGKTPGPRWSVKLQPQPVGATGSGRRSH